MKPARLLLVVCAMLPWPAQALTLDDVLDSSMRYYPKIVEAQEKIAAQQGKIQKTWGAFDWEYNQKNRHRVSGFYDGQYVETALTKRLSTSATRVYGGYRVSDGDFPIYEQEYPTLDRGEVNAGIITSLWRDRLIDEERFAYKDAQLEMRQKEFELLLTKLGVQYDAMNAYIDWVAAGLVRKVAATQVELAEARQEGFKVRVAHGDLAQIRLTENLQAILKRKAELTEAMRKVQEAAVKLSLYWRDADGLPVVPSDTALPPILPETGTIDLAALEQQIERVRSVRPDLVAINVELARQQNALLIGENKRLPKVDVFVEGARDYGDGPLNKRGNEAKLGLNISIPLQQNVGDGMVAQTKAEIRQIEQRRRLLGDQIASQIQTIANDYRAAEQNLDLTRREVDAAVTMQAAERTRFEEGAADYFVLNLREEKRADAELKYVGSQMKLWEAVARYNLATLQIDQFRIR